MFTKEDILARLQNGDTVDEIAYEMTNALNAAHTEYEEEQAQLKAEAAKADAEKTRVLNAKREAMRNIALAIGDYGVAANSETLAKLAKEVEKDEGIDYLIEKFDEFVEVIDALDKLAHLEFPKVEDKKMEAADGAFKITQTPATLKLDGVCMDTDAILANFLKGI